MYKVRNFCILVSVILLLSFYFSMLLSVENPIFNKVYFDNIYYYKFDLLMYLQNISLTYNSFTVVFDKLGGFITNFNNPINGMISIINVLIFILNLLVLPLSMVSSFSTFLFALLALPCNNTNVLYNILQTFSTLQIPYVPYVG